MILSRFASRSCKIGTQVYGSGRSAYCTHILPQKRRPFSKNVTASTAYTLRPRHTRYFVSSATSTNDSIDEVASNQQKDELGVSFRQSQHLSPSLVFTNCTTADMMWEKYLQVVDDPTINLKNDDYILLCDKLKWDVMAFTSIKRLQVLLRHLHQRGDMPKIFVRACATLMYLYLRHEDLDSALLVLTGMVRADMKPSSFILVNLLNGIRRYGSLKDATMVYNTLDEQGFFPADIRAYERLLKVLGLDFGATGLCDEIFTKYMDTYSGKRPISKRNIDAQPTISIYNLMLNVYLKNELPKSAWTLYQQLISSPPSSVPVKPDWKTYLIMMRTLQGDDSAEALGKRAALKEDMERHGVQIMAVHLDAMGLDANEAIKQITLTTYEVNTLMAAAMKNNKFNDALAIYNNNFETSSNLPQHHSKITPNLYSYSMAMRAFIKSSNKPTSKVFDVYDEMKRNDIKADKIVYSCLLQACAPSGDMDKAIGFLEDMRKSRIPLNSILFSSLLSILSKKPVKTEYDMAQLAATWDKISILEPPPDAALCNRYLALLAKYTPGIVDDTPTPRQAAAPTAGALSDEDINLTGPPMSSSGKQMMSVYRTMRQGGIKTRPDLFTYSTLINAMVNQNQVRQAMVLFRTAQRTTKGLGVSEYNILMQGLLKEDDPNPIMYLWRDMKDRRIWPDRTTYNLVLDACEKLGLVEPFKATLAQMQTDGDRLDRLDAKQK